jgi:phage shock protein PspC (stress-responsive transcriptional regulator)
MNRPAFRLERRDRKLIGVCAGIGRTLNVDPTFVRVAFVAVPLLTFRHLLAGAAGLLHLRPGRCVRDQQAQGPAQRLERMGERRGPASRTCARSSTPPTAG